MRGLNYANVTATLALFVALGTGGAYAVTLIGADNIKDNAVRTRHLKGGAVHNSDIATGAVGGAKVKDGSIRAADLADGVLPDVLIREGATQQISANMVGSAYAYCGPGEIATGGGSSTQIDVPILASRPVPIAPDVHATGWETLVKNTTASSKAVKAFVMCMPAP
jgi:hypothetical protein